MDCELSHRHCSVKLWPHLSAKQLTCILVLATCLHFSSVKTNFELWCNNIFAVDANKLAEIYWHNPVILRKCINTWFMELVRVASKGLGAVCVMQLFHHSLFCVVSARCLWQPSATLFAYSLFRFPRALFSRCLWSFLHLSGNCSILFHRFSIQFLSVVLNLYFMFAVSHLFRCLS